MFGPEAGWGDRSLCAPHGNRVPRLVEVVLVVLTLPYLESESIKKIVYVQLRKNEKIKTVDQINQAIL